jgi:hypothetical protein
VLEEKAIVSFSKKISAASFALSLLPLSTQAFDFGML